VHNLTFAGANSSTSPVTAPTVTNNVAAATAFGTATAITFTNGVSSTGGSMVLYKVEAASIAATDAAITTPAPLAGLFDPGPAAATGFVVAVERLAVGKDGVDLPGPPVRCALDPELVLFGVAAGGAAFVDQGEALFREPGLLRVDGVDVFHLDTEVVEGAALAGVLHEHELERGLGDGEVGVAGAALGGLGAEELGVERDRFVDVVDVECELDA